MDEDELSESLASVGDEESMSQSRNIGDDRRLAELDCVDVVLVERLPLG